MKLAALALGLVASAAASNAVFAQAMNADDLK
jgi:hypothetical protein